MIRTPFVDRELDGRPIDSRAKETRSHEVDGDSRFCGKRFVLKTRLYGDKRCLVCGVWFHWTEADCFRALRLGYADTMNRDRTGEPVHCGSAHCVEWWRVSEASKSDREAAEEARMVTLYGTLKRRGLVA
jgi:hypothetical protein